MARVLSFVATIAFLWTLYEACSQAKQENPIVKVPATTVSCFVTGGIDAAAEYLGFETDFSGSAKTWQGISALAVVVLLLWHVYMTGVRHGTKMVGELRGQTE